MAVVAGTSAFGVDVLGGTFVDVKGFAGIVEFPDHGAMAVVAQWRSMWGSPPFGVLSASLSRKLVPVEADLSAGYSTLKS